MPIFYLTNDSVITARLKTRVVTKLTINQAKMMVQGFGLILTILSDLTKFHSSNKRQALLLI